MIKQWDSMKEGVLFFKAIKINVFLAQKNTTNLYN